MLLLVACSPDCGTDGRMDECMEIGQPFTVPFHFVVPHRTADQGPPAQRPPLRAHVSERGLPTHLSFLLELVVLLVLS